MLEKEKSVRAMTEEELHLHRTLSGHIGVFCEYDDLDICLLEMLEMNKSQTIKSNTN